MSLHLSVALVSDLGLRRPKNDDSGYAGPRLLAVADGMGGHAGGDVASALTIDAIRDLDTTGLAASAEDEAGLLTDAAARADRRISERGNAEPGLAGMGTTLIAALVHNDSLVFAHIGDSRAYLYRPTDAPADGRAELVQITHDHTFVQSLVDEGQLTPEEAEKSPYRSVILRVLDGRPDNEPDTFVVDLVAGDRVLLCSDGLSDFVDRELVRERLATAVDPDEACRTLVDAALDAGAPDNVTVLVAIAATNTGDGGADQPTAADPDGADLDRAVSNASALAADTQAIPTSESLAEVSASSVPAPMSGSAPPVAASPRTPAPLVVGAAAMAAEESGEITMGNLPGDMLLPSVPDDGDDEDRRYAPRPRSRWRWLRRAIIAAVAVAVVVIAGSLGYRWTQQQYYVGPMTAANAPATVAIYQGIAESVTGLKLSHVREPVSLRLDQLPTYQRERVSETISVKSLAAAKSIVAQLTTIARRCVGDTTGVTTEDNIPLECSGIAGLPTPSHPPTPTATRTHTPSAKPTGKSAGKATGKSTAKAGHKRATPPPSTASPPKKATR